MISQAPRKRKNYPGNRRKVGSRDYGIILSKLIALRMNLIYGKDIQEIGNVYHKVATKLLELGFEKDAKKVKSFVGRRKGGVYSFVKDNKKDQVVELIIDCWRKGKEMHDQEKARAEILSSS